MPENPRTAIRINRTAENRGRSANDASVDLTRRLAVTVNLIALFLILRAQLAFRYRGHDAENKN